MRLPKAGELTMMMDPLPVYTEDDLRDHFRKCGFDDLAETVPVTIEKGNHGAKELKRATTNARLLIVGYKKRNRLLAALSDRSVQLQIIDIVECPVLVIPRFDEHDAS